MDLQKHMEKFWKKDEKVRKLYSEINDIKNMRNALVYSNSRTTIRAYNGSNLELNGELNKRVSPLIVGELDVWITERECELQTLLEE